MAPELHLNHQYMGDTVDIFALGIILFIMMSGAPPFSAAKIEDDIFI